MRRFSSSPATARGPKFARFVLPGCRAFAAVESTEKPDINWGRWSKAASGTGPLHSMRVVIQYRDSLAAGSERKFLATPLSMPPVQDQRTCSRRARTEKQSTTCIESRRVVTLHSQVSARLLGYIVTKSAARNLLATTLDVPHRNLPVASISSRFRCIAC